MQENLVPHQQSLGQNDQKETLKKQDEVELTDIILKNNSSINHNDSDSRHDDGASNAEETKEIHNKYSGENSSVALKKTNADSKLQYIGENNIDLINNKDTDNKKTSMIKKIIVTIKKALLEFIRLKEEKVEKLNDILSTEEKEKITKEIASVETKRTLIEGLRYKDILEIVHSELQLNNLFEKDKSPTDPTHTISHFPENMENNEIGNTKTTEGSFSLGCGSSSIIPKDPEFFKNPQYLLVFYDWKNLRNSLLNIPVKTKLNKLYHPKFFHKEAELNIHKINFEHYLSFKYKHMKIKDNYRGLDSIFRQCIDTYPFYSEMEKKKIILEKLSPNEIATIVGKNASILIRYQDLHQKLKLDFANIDKVFELEDITINDSTGRGLLNELKIILNSYIKSGEELCKILEEIKTTYLKSKFKDNDPEKYF